MCVPTVFIREDGKGFVVRKGGVDWEIHFDSEWSTWEAYSPGIEKTGEGETIMAAVDNALAKVRAGSPQRDRATDSGAVIQGKE